MPSKLQELGPCEYQVQVSVTQDAIKKALSKSLRELRTQFVIPGFRPGKVPMNIIESKFGKDVRHEVWHDLVEDGIQEAIEEHSLDIVASPTLEPPEGHEEGDDVHDHHVLPEDGDLEVTFKVEVKPEFELPKYRGVEVERQLVQITDEDIDRALQRIADEKAHWKALEEGPILEGDVVQGRVSVKLSEDVQLEEENIYFLIEDPQFSDLKVMGDIPELLTDTFEKPEVGLSFEVQDTHEEEDLHGQVMQGTIEVDSIRRRELPAIDDELATSMTFDSLEAMKVDIRSSMEESMKESADRAMVKRILDKLVDASDIPLPETHMNRLLENRLMGLERSVRYEEDLSEEEARARVDAEREDLKKTLARDTKAWYLVEAIAKKEKIFCLESDVDEAILKLAERYNAKPSQVLEAYESEGRMPSLRADVVERKVCEFLRDQAKVTEVETTEDEDDLQEGEDASAEGEA